MEIRKTTTNDIEAVLQIFASARVFMHTHGNPTQWAGVYPGKADVETDIRTGSSYVVTENGKVVGTFALVFGEEPTYRVITQGAWHVDTPYATIHRIASDGTVRGLAQVCFAFCRQQIDCLRIDTHRDNLPMQAAVEKFGFRKCGIVYMEDGDERIAYDYIKE